MQPICRLAVLLCFPVAIVAAGPRLQASDNKDEGIAFDIRGTIKKVDLKPPRAPANVLALITVEAAKMDKDSLYAKASVKVTAATKIVAADAKEGKPAALKDLKEGMRIEVVFVGLVINDREPVEGTAGKIVILPKDDAKNEKKPSPMP